MATSSTGDTPQPPPAGALAAGRPSRTGQVVAILRSRCVRPHAAEGDPDAQSALCAGMPTVAASRFGPMVAARTRYFDRLVADRVAGGTTQIVIVGAGYDDRALRFRTRGVRFWEVDHPATQTDKARRLAAVGSVGPGPILVAADLGREDAGAALVAAGLDPGVPSLVVCEGLFVYLDTPSVVRLLGDLRRVVASGSALAASLAVHPEGMDTAAVVAAANARRVTGDSEPWRTILPAAGHRALFDRTGWRVGAATDLAELGDELSPGRTLLVVAEPH